MIVACRGIARPMSKIAFVDLRNRFGRLRMIANAAMKDTSTAGITAPTVTMTLLKK